MTYQPDHAAFATPDRRPTLPEQWREVSARIDAEDALRRTDSAALLPATTDTAGRTLRHDGWTPERQRIFLAAIAEGETVERACRVVQMTVSSAYALRQRAAGAAFALGWRAAALVARDRLADRLMERAIEGQIETITRPDGSVVERHRYDNRIAMGVLARLDRMAEQAPADSAAAAASHAARLVAQDFEAFLAAIEQDRGPAQAGLFLARRAGVVDAPAASGLDPILALARADRFVRTGAGLAAEVDTADLDPARREDWTADQWRRADAAGLLRAATNGKNGVEPPLPPLVAEDEPVWWDDDAEEYRTRFPLAPDAEWVDQRGRYGDPDYERALTAAEQESLDAADAIDIEERRVVAAEARDAWFAGLTAEIAVVEGEVREDPTAVRPELEEETPTSVRPELVEGPSLGRGKDNASTSSARTGEDADLVPSASGVITTSALAERSPTADAAVNAASSDAAGAAPAGRAYMAG